MTPIRSHATTPLAAVAAAVAGLGLLGASTVASASTDTAVRVRGAGVRSASSAADVPFSFTINAKSLPASGGVYGSFSGSFPHDNPFPAPGDFATFQGAVTCLRVTGDKATIGGVVTSGYGYDDNYNEGQRDLTGDWFITTVQDNSHHGGDSRPDSMGYIDWGDRSYFAGQGFETFGALCSDPAADLGTAQFPLSSGDIDISG